MSGTFDYRFPYLARQINGPIANIFGKAISSIYEEDKPFIDFLLRFDIENLEGQWLDWLGTLLGFPRPFITIPELVYAFQFDDLPQILVASTHGFSNDPIHAFDNNGGVLDDFDRDKNYYPLEDARYQKYLRAIVKAKTTLSIASIADVLDTFVHPTRYAISFISHNDIQITLPPTYEVDEEYLETAFNSIFTTSPRVFVMTTSDFDENYTMPEISRVVEETTGSTDFTISYIFDGSKSIFTITLGASISSYASEVESALDEIYGDDNDIQIIVQTV